MTEPRHTDPLTEALQALGCFICVLLFAALWAASVLFYAYAFRILFSL